MIKSTFVFSVLVLITLSACQKKVSRAEALVIGRKGLEEYCQYKEEHAAQIEKIKISAFNNGNISSKDEMPEGYNWCDWCIEYVTKSNVTPRHILLIFIRGDGIVEQHSLIE